MKDKDNKPEVQENQTDPQHNEQEGNVLGKPFEKLFGDSEGGGALGEDEDADENTADS